MKPIVKKLTSLTLALCLLGGLLPSLPPVALAQSPDTLSITSGYTEAIVSTRNGGFSIRTEEGDVLTKDDNNKDLLYRRDAFDTSFTSFVVTEGDETREYIFGNDYSFLGLATNLTVTRTDRDIRAVWSVDGLTFTQILEPVTHPDSHQHGTIKIAYSVHNSKGNPVEVKARLLLDTALGEQDHAYYELAQPDSSGGGFFRVEKELVLSEANGDHLPANFFAYNDYTNPTIAAFTIRDESPNVALPYQMAFGHWNNLASTVFDFVPDGDLTFTNRYNKAYLTADSAFALYYDLGLVAAGQESLAVSTYYGVNSNVRVKASDRVGITLTAPSGLRLSADKASYLGPNSSLADGVMDITVNITNFPRQGAQVLERVAIAIMVDDGLVPLDHGGNNFDPAPNNRAPHYVEIGNLAAGDMRQLTFKLRADVLSNTTYRKVVLRAYDMSDPENELLLLENLLGSATSYILCPGGESDLPQITFTSAGPQVIYNQGTRHIYLTGTGFDYFNYKDDYQLKAYLKSDRRTHFTINRSNITLPETGVAQIVLTEDMPVGEYELVFEWVTDWEYMPQGNMTAPALSFMVTGDPAFRNDYYSIVAIEKQGTLHNTRYNIRAFGSEEAYAGFTGNVLLVFRGQFNISGSMWGISSCYAVSTSSKDSININGSLDFEKGNIHISQMNNELKVEFDGELYTTNSRTTVWKGAAELTPLTNGSDFGLIAYDERGERLTGGRQPVNIISIVWSGAHNMLQTIGGLAVDLRYGQFGAMYGGSGNNQFKGYVVSFGGKLDVSFLMPGGAKQSQALEREDHDKHQTDSTTTGSGSGVVRQDVSYKPSDEAKAENEKNKVKPVGKVNVEDVLYGRNQGFLGFNSQVELMLPKYFAPLPAMGGTLSINTIGGYAVGVKGITKTQKFNLEFELQVKNKPGSNVPIPDKIYFFMGGFEPGVNVDSVGAFWLTGLGGGVDKLYDTIFSGGLPPLTLLLSAEFDIIKAMSGRADLALSLQGFRITMKDVKFKNTSVVVLKTGQLAVEWDPDFYMHLAAYLELYNIIGGNAYLVVDDDFFELFTRTTVSVPDDVKIVGGMTVGGVDLGGNNDKLWGTLSALGIRLGLTYYWGGSTVHFGTGSSTAKPTYPELLGFDVVPVGVSEDTGETLYLHVGTNLWLAAEAQLVEELDSPGPLLMSADPKLTSNLQRMRHTLNLGTDTGDDAALTVRFSGNGRPTSVAEALTAISIYKPEPDDSNFALTFYDGTNIESANAHMVVDEESNSTSISFTITDYLAGDWRIETTQAADIVLYMVGALPEITSFTADHNTDTKELDLEWTGEMLNDTRLSIYVTPDIGVPGTDDTGEMGTLVGSLGGTKPAPVASGQALSLALPADLPSGEYYVRMVLSKEDQINESIIAMNGAEAFGFDHVNTHQPDAPQDVTLENRGDNMFEVHVGTHSVDFDGYQVSIYESTTAGGLVPTDFLGVIFTKDDTGTLPDMILGGTYHTIDDKPFGLTGGKNYVARVAAFKISDGGTPADETDDVAIFSTESASEVVTLRTPTPPVITFAPQPGMYKVLQKTIPTGDSTQETINVETFTTGDVSFALHSDAPVSGYWSINGALMQDLLDPHSTGINEVTDVSTINISVSLPDGEHNITFAGSTAEGDSFIFSKIFAVNTTPPRMVLRSPTNGSFFRVDGYLRIEGMGDNDTLYTILINGIASITNQTLATDDNGVFTYDLWLDPGVNSHNVTIRATNAVGNSVSQTAVVRNHGLASMYTHLDGIDRLNSIGVIKDGVIFTNKNIVLSSQGSTTAQLQLLATGEKRYGADTVLPFEFIISDDKMVSWSVFASEGHATIDTDGTLTISPGSVGFALGELRVADSGRITAAVTFGAEVYADEQYYLTLASTVGGIVSGTDGAYLPGAIINLTAMPNPGYRFAGWTSSKGGTFGNASAATTPFTMPSSSTLVTARFISNYLPETDDPAPAPAPPIVSEQPHSMTIYSGNNALFTMALTATSKKIAKDRTMQSITLPASLANTIAIIAQQGTRLDLILASGTGDLQPVVQATIAKEVLKTLKGIDINIITPYATLSLPHKLVDILAAEGQPLQVVIDSHSADQVRDLLPAGTEPLGEVLSVESDLRGKTRVTMILNTELPATEELRQAFLDDLMVFALHSSGDREMIYEAAFDIVKVSQLDEQGIKHTTYTLRNVSFWVSEFSGFVVVRPRDATLSTTVGVRGFTIADVTRDMVACYYKGNDTMMPIRMLDDFGVSYAWDEPTRTATMIYKQQTVALTIGSTDAYINGVKTPIVGASGALVAPELAPGRTMIPLRFVSEHLGFSVTWDPSNLISIRRTQ